MYGNNKRGYIALISTIIISATLIVALASLSTKSFYASFSLLDFELGKQARQNAKSCLLKSVLALGEDYEYALSRSELFSDSALGCTSIEMSSQDGGVLITSKAQATEVYAKNRARFDPGDFLLHEYKIILEP